jgi:subtilisin family serine protease
MSGDAAATMSHADAPASSAPPVLSAELASGQWHLGKLGNIGAVWAEYSGRGVKVGIYDSGVQYSHWDLDANYDTGLHVTIAGKTFDGDYRPASGGRGTSLAGLIAAENNGAGTVGVAYGATITGVNILDPYSGEGLDPGIWINVPGRQLFARALQQRNTMDVAVDGWGRTTPDFAGASSRGVAGTDAARFAAAFEDAAQTGRGGLGTISLNGAGNTRQDAQADSAFTSRHTITVGAYRQEEGYATTTSGRGASLLVSAPSGDPNGSSLIATDLLGRFGSNLRLDPGGDQDVTNLVTGTAAAASTTAAVVALMLEANAGLGWRDVSGILAASASLPIDWNDRNGTVPVTLANGATSQVRANESYFSVAGASGANWNGGGHHYSSDYGYGAVNAHAAVRMAEVASLFGPARTSANESGATTGTMAVGLRSANNLIDTSFYGDDFVGEPTEYTFEVDGTVDVEHADLTINYLNSFVGRPTALWGTKIKLIAPDGTVSFVDTNLAAVVATSGEQSFTFGLANLRGVRSEGTWTLQFENAGPNMITDIVSAKLDLYGSAPDADDVHTYTDEYLTMVRVDPRGGRRILTDTDGGTDWINAAAVTSNVNLSLVAGTRTTFGGVAAFTIARAAPIENAVTGDGNDVLTGTAGANILYGMRGNDTLNGGAGNDTLAGGRGVDIFRFTGTSGQDRVLDWEAGDLIETTTALSGVDGNGTITVGPDGLLLLGATGNSIELVGQAGAVLRSLGSGTGFNRYAWVSGNAVDHDAVMRIVPAPHGAIEKADEAEDGAVAPTPARPAAITDAPGLAALGAVVDADVPLDSMGRAVTQATADTTSRYTTWGPETLARDAARAAPAATYPAPASITDPFAAEQWHLAKLGDMDAIWRDYTGKGVKVGVYDSGVEYGHEDLAANYDAGLHVVIGGKTFDGDFRPLSGGHGTSVAGLIAASRNGIGAVGVAYDATVTGINIFDPYSGGGLNPGIYVNATDRTAFVEAMRQAARFDIANHSWGRTLPGYLSSDSRTVAGTEAYDVARAFAYSAVNGRGGLGTINVAAAGNSSIDFQGDGSHTDRHVIAVGAYRQVDGLASNYSSRGPALLISAPSNDLAIIGGTGVATTDLTWREGYNLEAAPGGDTDYTDQFGGTSAATPIVSGVVALMLEANGALGWRDVQTIVASSATMPVAFEDRTRLLTYTDATGATAQARMNEGWFSIVGSGTDWNGGGRHYSPDYGYGAIDARAAVRMAEVWSLFGAAQTSANEVSFASDTFTANLAPVPQQNVVREDSYTRFTGTPASYDFTVSGAQMDVEQVDMTISYKAILQFGTTPFPFSINSPVKIALEAPDGTEAFFDLLPVVPGSGSSLETQSYTFGFRNFSGAELNGTWTLKAESSFATILTIETVKLDFHGARASDRDIYTYTDEFFTMAAIAGEEDRRMLRDTGGADWINAAAVSADVAVSLAAGATTRFGGVDAFTIAAGTAIEHAVTGDGDDRLIGNASDNRLYGMRGDDWLNGGAGNDELSGGDGHDVFAFDTQGKSGRDTVIDWGLGDRIATTKQLRGADVNGQITVAANALVLLDNSARGDTVELTGAGGAVLQARGRANGYWWYDFVSDEGEDYADGHVVELAWGPGLGLSADRAAAPADATIAVAGEPTDQTAFYLYNALGDAMSTGVQVYA